MNNRAARVLVVDDEAPNRRLFSDLIRREGYEPLVACGGREALEILALEDVDLVLLDLMMPEVDGMTVLSELNRRQVLPALPVVIVSAHEERRVRIDALAAGATDFLTKPIDRLEVLTRVRTLIDLKRLREQAVTTATHELLGEVREAAGSLPLVLYRTGYPGDPPVADSWVIGDTQRLLGLTSKEFSDPTAWLELLSSDDRDAYHEALQDVAGGAISTIATQLKFVRPKRSDAWMINIANFDRDRRLQTGALLDITDQKQLELSLLQSQKMDAFGQLAGGIAHDFNNTLGAIVSFAGFIRESLPATSPIRADVNEVLKAAERAAALTRQLLTFTRQQPSHASPTDLNERLGELTNLLRRTLGDHIELIATPAVKPAVVRIDPIQFDQIVLNLAVNARDAMPNGGKLRLLLEHCSRAVGTASDAAWVRLTVTDTGHGMDADTQQRIFEPFYTTKPQGKGTGLGLATAFGIVSGAGGTLEVESAVGKGTSFILELPATGDRVQSQRESVRPHAPRAQGELILVVEDEEPLRRVATRALENAGFTVHTAGDGTQALARLDELGPSLAAVWTDVMMPGATGYEVAEKAARVAPQAKVLLTSGYLDNVTRRHQQSNLPILWKPVKPSDLVRAVSSAIKEGADPEAPASDAVLAAADTQSALETKGEDAVLLVEDNDPLRTAMARALTTAGYLPCTAGGVAEACAHLAAGLNPIAILSDLTLPDASGVELLRWVSAHRPTLTERVIILTGGTNDKDVLNFLDAGRYPVLEKPCAPDLLLGKLAALRGTAAPIVTGTPHSQRRGLASNRFSLAEGSVLLVEDDPSTASAFQRILKEAGFDPYLAGSLGAAREALDTREFDALVSDLQLPDGSGLELLRTLRGNHADLPVILITGAPSVESAAEALRGRVREYLAKPVTGEELVQAVFSAVEGGRVARLRAKLLTSHYGGDELLLDIPDTQQSFARALASIRMVYQPIVRARDSSIYAYEALLRCGEPSLASPIRLLAAAEILGRTEELGRAVRKAIASTILEHSERLESIFVNIHPSELAMGVLIDSEDPLLPVASRVVLEVTERASIEAGPTLEAILKQLRYRGYRFAVDDLGQGYAGLTSLLTLQPDIVKIDMSLVRDVHRAPLKRDVIEALIHMARRAGIAVVAEGVETEEERRALAELHVDLLQGYFFAKPGPPFPQLNPEAK